ncbi:MAG: hypothetical protein A4S09_05690 [Proteobacteria bacterium SG_bin7]|nr:MAG: hypothetical protein A4S09_05690 [Proteobacteria bacterium SG_bin7]
MPEIESQTPFKEIVKLKEPSKFFAKEMIFDCMRGHIHADRAAAIEKLVDRDEELKHQKNLIGISSKYCTLLSKIEVSDKFLADVSGTVSVVDKVRTTIIPRNWPVPVKWGLEAFIVSAVVAAVSLALFWTNIETLLPQKQEMVLAREKIHKDNDAIAITDQGEIAEVHKTLAKQTPAEGATDAIEQPGPEKTAPAPVETAAKVEEKKTAEAEPTTTPAATKPSPIVTPAPKLKGYVYKQFMNLTDLETIAPEITAKIVELGGEKAGEVELGWKKPNGRYYHFVMPTGNREILIEFLKTYGALTEVKDPHVRVMPEGEERYILWIEGS